jgi:hypothetical protein
VIRSGFGNCAQLPFHPYSTVEVRFAVVFMSVTGEKMLLAGEKAESDGESAEWDGESAEWDGEKVKAADVKVRVGGR